MTASLRLVLTLSRTSLRHHAWRRMHQTVAQGLSNEHLQALYQDLMIPEPATTPPKHQLAFDTTPANKTVDVSLAEYATKGNTRDFELTISRLSAPPTELQRDLHVKAHIVNASLPAHPFSLSTTLRFPTSALAVLHEYEASGHFAPVKSYTRVISALFNVQTCPASDPGLGSAAAQAQAWDLFAHMRYVAHPVPDAHLYALMIRACGSFSRPEPERALDLWTEMRENGAEPTKGAYEAIIKVCGRAGQEWLGEGMRLAREMSERYSVGRGLWCGLLEGCKRVGDLNKARWILAEAVRGSGDGASSGDSMLDAELMTHIFHTYASYKPPFKRETTRLVDRSGEPSSSDLQAEEISNLGDASANPSAEQTREGDVSVENVESTPSFSRLPPQTSSDVIVEARALFDRILQDKFPSSEGTYTSQGSFLEGRFARVELSPVLLNAYLSVFYRHASIEASQEAFDFLFSGNDSFGGQVFHPDEHACISALERCAIARAEDRHIAARWAEDVWRRWEVIEAKGLSEGRNNVGSFARMIEKAHTAARRVLTLSGDIDGALTLLRSFVARYPPKTVLRPTPTDSVDASPAIVPTRKSTTNLLFARPPILSTRTSLTNPATSTARPLVRLTSAASPKDDRVPPIIAFGDVDLLHARLVEHGRIKDVGYIKWVCIAYASALKKRRAEYIGVY